MGHKVYLAGPITGLTYDGSQGWRDQFTRSVSAEIECYSPLRGKEYLRKYGNLEGSYEEFPLSTARGITSRDRFDCTGAELVVFNLLGAKTVSIGTVIEMGWADGNRIPTIVIMEPKGNPHEHPMVSEITNFRVTTVEDAIKLTEIILLPKRVSIDQTRTLQFA